MLEYSRRAIFQTGLGGFLNLIVALPLAAQRATPGSGSGRANPIDWDAFIEQIDQASKAQFRPAWDQEAYVADIAALARRLRANGLPAPARYRNFHVGVPEFSDLERRVTFEATLITFERGESIPHHDHPDMTAVALCANGELEVENFEELPNQSDRDHCFLKKVKAAAFRPGQVSTLTTRRANIHRISAHSFCQVVDIFTPPYDARRTARTRWFDVEPNPLRPGGSVYAARIAR